MLASEPKDYPLQSKRKQELVVQDTRVAHVLVERAITELDDEGPSSALCKVATGLSGDLMSHC